MIRWTVHLKGGAERCLHAVVVQQDKLYFFGGDSDPIDVHIFNTVSLCWRKLTPGRGGGPHLEVPSRRIGHTAVLIEYTVYIWGGSPYCNALYAFDADVHRWFKPRVSGTVPEKRCYHSACVLEKVMYIYGGSTKLTGDTNDMYKLDTSTMVWTLINPRGTPPLATYLHSATIIGTKMFVFGGCGQGNMGSQYNNTIRVFDTEADLWLSTPSTQPLPERRWAHLAFTYNGELYIFGGYSNKTLNDVWKFSPETLTWKKVEPKGKGPGPMYRMCSCIVRDRIILFGGHNKPKDLCILDMSPSLETLCKLAVNDYGLEQSGLPHNIRWELAAMMTTNNNNPQQ